MPIAQGENPFSRRRDFPDHRGFARFASGVERGLPEPPHVEDHTKSRETNPDQKWTGAYE